MSELKFDPTINLGHILSLGGILFALVGSWYLMDYRLTGVEKAVERLSTIVIESAGMKQQIADHARRLDRLEAK